MKGDLMLYRVYGTSENGTFDEYVWALTPQSAVDKAIEWHKGDPNYLVVELARVLSRWKNR